MRLSVHVLNLYLPIIQFKIWARNGFDIVASLISACRGYLVGHVKLSR